jgi:hypothetical protein
MKPDTGNFQAYNPKDEYVNHYTGLSPLESRIEALEARPGSGRSGALTSAAYCLGSTLAAILSWHSYHALIWAFLAGMFSWAYVFYYVIVNWNQTKFR